MGKDKITHEVLTARLELLDSYWKKFSSNHDDMLLSHFDGNKDASYFENDWFNDGAEVYVKIKAEISTMIRNITPAASTHAYASIPTNLTVSRALPKISLPKFSGEYHEWLTFRDLFQSLVVDKDDISAVEKLHYLKTHCEGEAARLLSTFSITEANFSRAWDALVVRYHNKRALLASYFDRLQKLKPGNAAVGDLKHLMATMHELNAALEALEVPPKDIWNLFLLHFLSNRLDADIRKDWEIKLGISDELPTLSSFEDFVNGRIRALELLGLAPVSKQSQFQTSVLTPRTKVTARSHAVTTPAFRCSFCRSAHYISSCPLFAAKPLSERRDFVQVKQLCFNCLGEHRVNQCRTSKRCRACGELHHTLLHSAHRATAPSSSSQRSSEPIPSTHPTSPSEPSAVSNATSSAHSHCAVLDDNLTRTTTLLATAVVILESESGQKIAARALLDQGSELSFVCESLAQSLKLPRTRASIPVVGIGSHVAGSTKGKATLSIRSRFDSEIQHRVIVYILPQLTGRIPAAHVKISSWPHLENLKLADPNFSTPSRIDIILGADLYGTLLRGPMRRGGPQAPVAQLTTLGWVISGPVVASSPALSTSRVAHSVSTSLDHDIYTLMQRFWEQEEVPALTAKPLTSAEEACETHFKTTHSRISSGRYVVRLPFCKSPNILGNSRAAANRMLQRTQRRMQSDIAFGQLYIDFLSEYETLSHMARVQAVDSQKAGIFYLPHHGVVRENSSTTKLRVVFNGSAPTTSGASLNDCLHIGPKLQSDLADVILRWRRHNYVFVADIKMMYRQILVHSADRDYQRILWSPSGIPQEFQLCTVTYGLACAPYLALRVIRQLAEDERARFPLAIDILRDEMYVDDVLSGGDSVETAQEKASQLRDLLMAGGFPLQKWSSNDPAVLAIVAPGDKDISSHNFNGHHLSRTLGLSWDSFKDAFVFQFPSLSSVTTITKRTVLSRIAQIFDPLGWITPITITAKIFMQLLWKLKCDWDSPLPPSMIQVWQAFENSLAESPPIFIPRWFGLSSSSVATEIHGFSDASHNGLGAVVYLRVYNDLHSVQVSILAAKSKVAPLAQQTIPRLELSAAVLLVRLVKRVLPVLNLQNCPTHLWVDSSVVLSWLKGHPSQWKEYVANRVAFIQTEVPKAYWHHIAGIENPADCASRGLNPNSLANLTLWWSGPSWLLHPSTAWPQQAYSRLDHTSLERRSSPAVAAVAVPGFAQWDLVERYSSLRKLVRVTAWIFRARDKFRKLSISFSNSLSPSQIAAAELFWVKQTQQAYFASELTTLSRGTTLPHSHPFLRLAPFVDADGLLRLGGRLRNAKLEPDAKHPILLPRASPFTLMIIDDAHRRTLHGGVQVMLATLRQRYWILGGRAPVSSFVRKCVRCARYRAATAQEMMGQLPVTRVTPSRPFTHSGVDYAGPFSIKTWRGRAARTYKGFLIVFVCFSTSAVHLELATDYSTQGFLAAYRRFVSRRGICATLTSDCGTNLIGADAELKRLFHAASKEVEHLSHLLAADGTQWRFNPPAAPHFGGKWEAAVKSVKFHLRRTVGDAVLTYEEFSTLLTQIEAVLNSRPLCALSDDPSDVQALTPAHFLIGEPLSSLPTQSHVEIPTSRLSRWQVV